MHFFVHSRAAAGAGSAEHDPALDEAHWSYMDGFAEGMTARGPTLAPDRELWTGSLHIVRLESAEAARAFAEREPYNRAGLYEHHSIHRFENLAGRTMWEFQRGSSEPRFLVIARRVPAEGERRAGSSRPAFAADLRERLILYGALLAPDGGEPRGLALALQAPSREGVGALLEAGCPGLGRRFDLEILDWELGGRR